MLVQIVVVIQDIALRLHGGVAPCPSCLLDIILQGAGDVIVDDQPNILFVHAHAEGRGRHDHPYLVADECLLVRDFLVGLHFSVEGARRESVGGQLDRQLFGLPYPGNIDDGGAILLGDQVPEGTVLLLIRLFVQDRVMQVLPRGGGREDFQVQVQLLLEIIADIPDHLLLCGGGKAGYGDRLLVRFLILQLPDKVANVQIIHPEILPPRREAVRLVNDEAGNVPGSQRLFNAARAQLLRRDVQQCGGTVADAPQCIGPLDGAEQAIDRYRLGNAQAVQVVHLVLHQRLQRRDHDGQAMERPACHKRRQLERDRFSPAGGKNCQQGFAVHRSLRGPLLERFAVIGAEAVVAEGLLQRSVDIQHIPAVCASLCARRTAQVLDHILDPGEIPQQPRRRDGVQVIHPDQGEGIRQLSWIMADQGRRVRVGADLPGKLRPDQIGDVGGTGPEMDIFKKAGKFRETVQQGVINQLDPRRQGQKRIDLIKEQILRLFAVVYGIVQLVGLQLIILQQRMVRALGKQQRRQVQRIDRGGVQLASGRGSDILQVVMDDVMSADELRPGNKRQKIVDGWRMEGVAVLLHRAKVTYFFRIYADLGVNKYNRLCHGAIPPIRKHVPARRPVPQSAAGSAGAARKVLIKYLSCIIGKICQVVNDFGKTWERTSPKKFRFRIEFEIIWYFPHKQASHRSAFLLLRWLMPVRYG